MNQSEQKACFGTMFPDDLHLKTNKPNKGKVFTVWMKQQAGTMLPVHSDRTIETDIEQWLDCQQCPVFESCYKLCVAKVTLESAIAMQ